jgi:putative ABC transport system permease protein
MPPDPRRPALDVAQQSVSRRYFDVMRIGLHRGREFAASDTRDAPAVAIVNEALVRRYFGNDDPLGQRIRLAGQPGGTRGQAPPNRWLTIVGIVADEQRTDVRRELGWTSTPILYVPITQRAVPAAQLLVRPRGMLQAEAIQRVILDTEPGIVAGAPQAVDDVIGEYFRYPRFRAWLLAAFALVSLVLAAVGLHAVLAQAVAQRGREIGLRLALGATRGSIIRQTAGEGMLVVAIGVAVGLLLTIPLSGVLRSLLYEVAPTSPLMMASVSAVLLIVGSIACYLPARRASRTDPVDALRAE